MYENYGGKRPAIPNWAVEVGYREAWPGEPYIDPSTGEVCVNGTFPTGQNVVVLARKPKIDPALVPPQGYQFRLDEYGRPVCRAPKEEEWFLGEKNRTAYQAAGHWHWSETRYILDKIPEPPKMTIVEAANVAKTAGHSFVKSRSSERLINIYAIDNLVGDDWEVAP